MKTLITLLIVGWLTTACSSGPSERKATLDERQERMGESRVPVADDPGPSGPAVAERGPVGNDFDQDRDGVPHADEANDPGESAPDNTARNEDAPDAPTALDQSNSSSDLEITQAIRKKVIDHEGLSFNAKNVKIITVGGKVTLRGPVETSEERSAIESSARSVPGVARVDNQLQVKR